MDCFSCDQCNGDCHVTFAKFIDRDTSENILSCTICNKETLMDIEDKNKQITEVRSEYQEQQ